jgi:glycerol-3-phosphate acyltransferase PlsY
MLDAATPNDSNADMTPLNLLIPAGYLVGSISTAIIVCRLMGLPDPRTQGSNNPGATNVARIGGKQAAILTLLGDMLKGLLPVLAGHWLQADALTLAGTALAAFLGHLYPVFFRFQGGKGVATALGVTFGLHWPVGLLAAGTWLGMAVLFRYSSLAALVASLAIPAGFAWLWPDPYLVGAMCIMVALLYWRHRSNIANLLAGREGKISFRKQ